jgi:DNA-binding transcriptional LysR family regulator
MAVQVHQVEANMSSLTTMLAEGELDIAFVRLPCESSKAFELKILDREPMVVALHRDHPLAACDSLALEQLRDTPVVLFPQEVAPGLYDERVHGCCERAGIDVQHALQSRGASCRMAVVAGGFAEHGFRGRRVRAGAEIHGGHFTAECHLSRAELAGALYRYRALLAAL